MLQMQMDHKKEFFRFLAILAIGVLGAALPVLITDPFYQYHCPWFGMPVILDNAVYQTAGAARTLNYEDVIVGTSMTENFHTSWFDEEMGWHTIKLSYSGSRSDDLKMILSQIFTRKTPVNHIIMDINDYQLTCPSWTAYVERPEYLCDSKIWNDYAYIYNRDVIARGWERALDAIEGVEDNIDTAYTWEDSALFGTSITLEQCRETRRILLEEEPNAWTEEELQQMVAVCQENLDNILPFIRDNPDTEFIIYFPPYSMLYWERKKLEGNLWGTLQIYKYAIEQFLSCRNVKVHYFQNEKEIITELEYYRDEAHHRPEINRYIFECVKNGEKRVLPETLEQEIQEMFQFADSYDYEVYWR